MLSIHFEAVTKRFEQTVAVDNLNLEIRAGELFFLLGPSGCGKTTCLRMTAGFYQPDGGQLRFGERVMNAVPPHRRNTGMVFQNYALWPHLTARGNIEYGLKVRKMARAERDKRVDAALEMVRLPGLGDRYPNQMSGGQQQRVALARALVIQPDVVLLDEPLSNLDAQLRLEMRNEIKRLHGETGTTALYVTHDQEEALSIADRIAVMKDGRLQQVGAPRELYRLPQNRFVAEFLGETNFLSGTVTRLDSDSIVVATEFGDVQATRFEATKLSENQEVWCSIRPESWHVETEEDKAPQTLNRFAGHLESVVYLGQVEQYRVQLAARHNQAASAGLMKVAVANPRVQAPQAGAAIGLWCAPQDVVVLAQ
jgi:iron(III) transport system ATP-binding protein